MAKKNDLAKNTILLSIGTFMTKGLSFVMVPFFSRWLSTDDYGTFDLLCTYVTLLLPVIGLASQEALFRFSMDVDSAEDKAKYVTNCLLIFVSNTFLFFCTALVLRVFAGWHLAMFFFFLALGEVFNLHLQGYLRAVKRLDIYSFGNALSTIFIAIFTTIFLKVIGLGLEGIILGYGFGYLAGDIFIVVTTKYWNYIYVKFISIERVKELVKYSHALIPNSLAWWFINVSDRTIINVFLGAGSNGIYAIAYKIPNILSSVFSVFSVSWQQSATEALDDNDRNEYYNIIYNKMSVVLMSLCCGILSLNSWLFNYIFDIKYYAGHLYAPILIGSTVFATLSQFYGSIQISFKQPKENGITTVIGAISNLIIHMGLIHFCGLFAAAISTILSQVIVCALRNIRLRKSVILQFKPFTIICFFVYLYFTISAYYISNNVFNAINVLMATVFVLYVNKDFVVKLLGKMRKKV